MNILYFEIFAVLMLMLMNGIFSMSELAIVSSKKVHLQRMADEGSKAAKQALIFAENPSLFLPTVQIGITLIGIIAGAFSGATLADHLTDYLMAQGIGHDRAEFISVTCMVVSVTYLTLIIGELVPKELALRRPEKMALFVAPLISLLSRLTWPIVWLLNRSSKLVLWIVRAGDMPETTVTQEEVKAMIAEGTDHGIFAESEQDMLGGVMLLANKPIRAFIMPRIDVVSISSDASMDDIREILEEAPYSRFPVVDPDDEDHVLGVVHSNDILVKILSGKTFKIRDLVKEAPVFPDTTDTINVIEKLRDSAVHVAIIVDEHGTFEGIVTLTDLVSVITGRLYEHREESGEIVSRDENSWLIDGYVLIDHVCDKIGLANEFSDSGYHTLAGFILHQFRKVPKPGEAFEYKQFRFEVVDVDGHRIDKVLVSRIQ